MKKSLLLTATLVLLIGSASWAVQELVKVNGRSITDQDLSIALSGFNDLQKKSILSDKNSKKQIVDNLVDQELMVIQAEKEKLEQTGDYKMALEAFRKQYLTNLLIQKKIRPKISDSSAKAYYEKYKANYSTDQVHAQHILLPTVEKAQQVLKQAKEKDADFMALAEKNSIDPSAKNNRGELGYFTRDQMVPEFTSAAFGGAIGDIVGPIKTAYGYHLIKVLDKRKGKALEYHEVELQVKGALQQQLVRDYLVELKKTAKIQYNDKAL